jgi:peptide/nickel transport system permease protein
MLFYIIKRILLMIPILLSVAVLTFFLLRVVPGDVVEVKLRADGAAVTEEVIERERARLGLNEPLPTQFLH